MHLPEKWRRRRGGHPTYLDTFRSGALFAFAMALVDGGRRTPDSFLDRQGIPLVESQCGFHSQRDVLLAGDGRPGRAGHAAGSQTRRQPDNFRSLDDITL